MYEQGHIPVRRETKRLLDGLRKEEGISFDALLSKMIGLYAPDLAPELPAARYVTTRTPGGWMDK